MPYRKQQFVNSGVYHIVLRGLDDNLIFRNVDDYYRGIFSIYEFNTAKPVTIQYRRKARAQLKKELVRGPSSIDIAGVRDKMVDVLSFCFMPNHIHLLIKQFQNDGVIKFMRKIGTGYAGYFNRKYNRRGYVFQNRFVAVPVKDEVQLKVVFTYIHANPTALIEPGWKEEGIKNPEEVIKFLEDYKWSSYQDYIGGDNFPSVTERDLISGLMNGPQGCRDFVNSWIKNKGKIKEFSGLALE